MNNDKNNGSHRSMQELMPNTPARVVATATITLSTMLHTDFFSVDINLFTVLRFTIIRLNYLYIFTICK